MKNVSLILNIVLVIAVVILYYLHFSSNSSEASTEAKMGDISNLQIAYVNSDSILKNYDYFKVSRAALEAKGKKLDADFRNRAESLQRDITSYQNTANNLTISQARAVEEDLTKKQQNLRVYQESLGQELSIEEGKVNQDLYNRVTAYLKKLGTEKGIQVVLKYDQSSDLLFGGEGLDITSEVITGLNDEYKNKEVSASDSTKVK